MQSKPDTQFDWTRYEERFAKMERQAAREAARYLPLLDQYDVGLLFDLYELPDDQGPDRKPSGKTTSH
jgi:hypothetical protein